MGWDAWLTIFVTLGVLIALAFERPADLVFMSAILVLSLAGVITPKLAFEGFVNSSLLMVAALFVVTAGLKETGVVDTIGEKVLGPARTETGGLTVLSLFTIVTSAFMNNTPIVAMLIPVVIGWCRKHSVAPSKLLIPLSFTTILGGACSRIGTSTNLVVAGLMKSSDNPEVQRLLGVEVVEEGQSRMGSMLGLSDEWAYNIISQVGNYGESFEEHVGVKTPLGLARGLNQLWSMR